MGFAPTWNNVDRRMVLGGLSMLAGLGANPAGAADPTPYLERAAAMSLGDALAEEGLAASDPLLILAALRLGMWIDRQTLTGPYATLSLQAAASDMAAAGSALREAVDATRPANPKGAPDSQQGNWTLKPHRTEDRPFARMPRTDTTISICIQEPPQGQLQHALAGAPWAIHVEVMQGDKRLRDAMTAKYTEIIVPPGRGALSLRATNLCRIPLTFTYDIRE